MYYGLAMLREFEYVYRTRGLMAAGTTTSSAGATSPTPLAKAAARSSLSLLLFSLQTATALVALAGLFVAIWAAEEVFTARVSEPFANPLGRTPTADSLKAASSVLTAAVLLLAVLHAVFDHRLRVLVGLALPGQSLLDVLWSARGAQLGICLLQAAAQRMNPLPGVK